MCPHRGNIHEVEDLVKLAISLGAGSVKFNPVCNNDCRHCYIGLPAGDAVAWEKEMTPAEIERIASQGVRMGTIWCLITGGEPLLRPDFEDIYLRLKRLGLLVSVFTNATLITEDHIRLFHRYPPRDIEVTVYGVTRETYERISRRPGSFEAFMSGLDRLIESGIPVRLKAMAMRSNLAEFPAIARFCKARTKDYYRFDPQTASSLRRGRKKERGHPGRTPLPRRDRRPLFGGGCDRKKDEQTNSPSLHQAQVSNKIRHEWLSWRRQGIGASDAPVIMGQSPWQKAHQLLLHQDRAKRRTAGQRRHAAGQDARTAGPAGVCQPHRYRGRPVCVQSRDHTPGCGPAWTGLSADGRRVVEIKCPGEKDHQLADSGSVPEKYYAQLQHILAVTGLAEIHYWSFRSDHTVLLKVDRDEPFIAGLIEKEAAFWTQGLRRHQTDARRPRPDSNRSRSTSPRRAE